MSLKTTKNSSPILGLLLTVFMSVLFIGNIQAQENTCDSVTIVLIDTYGDGWNGNSLTVGDAMYTQVMEPASYEAETFSACVDLSSCVTIAYNATGFYSEENLWEVTVNATGETYSSDVLIGTCVTACTDELADNYDPAADISDNSLCEYSVMPGCMDPTACNFDADAGQDDGSCAYPADGFDCAGSCLSGDALTLTLYDQYDDGWDYYDGSVSYLTINGVNYGQDYLGGGPLAITICADLLSCTDVYFTPANGWSSENSWDIADAAGNILVSGGNFGGVFGECGVLGCMDASACNYNMDATTDDGSCSYATEGFDCDGNCLSGVAVVYTSGFYAGENNFAISDCDGNVLASMSSGYNGFNSCVELGENYSISLNDTWGDGWNGGNLSVGGVDYTIADGSDYFEVIGSCGVAGCMDPTATNYNADATFDDGSCTYPLAFEVSIPFEGVGLTTCGFNEDYDAGNTSYSGYYLNGDDVAYIFTGTGNNFQIDMTSPDTYTAVVVFDGDPLYGSNVVDFSTMGYSSTGTSHSFMMATTEGTSYYVVIDSWPWPQCIDFDLSIVELTGIGGCTDSTAFNFNPDADYNDGSCIPVIEGCTNPFSNNYNASANTDDASCTFCVDGVEVTELPAGQFPDQTVVVTINTGYYSGEIGWELQSNDGTVLMSGGNLAGQYYSNYSEYIATYSGCLSDGCYKFVAIDTWGDGWNESGSFTITDQYGSILIPTTVYTAAMGVDINGDQTYADYFAIGDASCAVYGCTDAAASNYLPEATDDDGSCIFCEEGSNDIYFVFSQENELNDAVYVFNETDTVFSVEPGSLGYWGASDILTCVPTGCYTVAMFAQDGDGWDDGSTLITTDGLGENNLTFDFETGTVSYVTWAVGDTLCENVWVPGCMDTEALNFDATATFDDGTCVFLGDECETALTGVPSEVFEATGTGSWIEVCADPEGFGALVFFDEISETGVTYQAVNVNLDSCNGLSDYGFVDYEFNLIGSFELEAGECLYFQAVDPYGYVNYSFYGFGSSAVTAVVQENPDTSLVPGCIDPLACNYDSLAQANDWSCVYPEEGFDCEGNCLDGTALYIYDTFGDGWNGNVLTINGDSYTMSNGEFASFCVPTADCYTFEWTLGSWLSECSWQFNGVTYSGGAANLPDTYGTGCVTGCNDTLAVNYEEVDIVDNSLCQYDLTPGCMDALACNYDPAAEQENGTCTYPAEGLDCNGDCLTGGNFITLGGGYYENEISFVIVNCESDTLLTGGGYSSTIDPTVLETCFDLGDNFIIYMYDTWGDGWNGNILNISGQAFTLSEGSSGIASVGECAVGCMDPTALNYDATATIDDGTCTYLGDDCETALVGVPSEVFESGDAGNWVEVCADPNGFGAVVSFQETSATGVYYQQAIVAVDSCDAVQSLGFVNTSSSLIGTFELEAGQCLYFQANDIYGYVNYDFYGFGSSAVSAIVQENPDTNLIPGCTDPVACNFNPEAQAEDYSCEYPVEGFDCDGLCLNGGMMLAIYDSFGDGWNGNALTINDETFTMTGSQGFGNTGDSAYFCVEPADCYEFSWTLGSWTSECSWTFGDIASGSGSTVPEPYGDCGVLGCTDPGALNYNADATTDDGSCTYPVAIDITLPYEGLGLTTCGLNEDYDASNTSYVGYYLNGDDAAFIFVGTGNNVQIDMTSPDTYTGVVVFDGDPLSGASVVEFSTMGWSSTGTSHSFMMATTEGTSYYVVVDSWPSPQCIDFDLTIVELEGIGGCTDETAFNYNPDASYDDGSCIAVVEGCMDANALNYNANANTDDGSCDYCTIATTPIYMYDSWGDGWNGATYTITDGTATFTGGMTSGSSAVDNLCIPDGCYEVTVGGGFYDIEVSFSFGDLVNVDAGTYSEVSIGNGCNPMMMVNFAVDMNAVGQPNFIDYDNVVINGSWNGWNGWGVVLADADADGIWTGSGEFDPAIGQFEYVVAVTGPTDGYSGWGMQWGNGCANTNFLLIFEDGVDTYSQDIAVGCESAGPTVFNVDMSCAGVDFTTVHLTGPLWGWTTDIIMSDDDGDGIYSITMEGLSGDIEYKYMVDYWASQENLVDDMLAGATCAPVTDYAAYANRVSAAGSTTSDTYGSCSECSDVIPGCTDPAAENYNANATEDDGSCNYCATATVTFNVNAGALVTSDYDNVVVNGTFNGPWYGWGVTLTDEDGDGIYSGTTEVEAGVTHQYVHALTGAADGWSGWGVIGYAPEACALGVDPVSGDAAPNYFFTAECGEVIDLPTVCFGECIDCSSEPVFGCTDASADNFNPNATEDDGSCTFCGAFEAVLIGSSDVTTAGGSDGTIQATGTGGSSNYEVNVFDANDAPQNPFALSAGTYTVVVTDVNSDCSSELTVTISEPVVAANPCDIVPSGLFVDNIIHNRVVFNWSAPSAAPSHYMIRYRALGTSSWTVMTAGPVNSNEFTGTSRTRYFMEPATTYEWSMRARVLNEDLSINCQSAWSANYQYTTLAECANLENLSVSTEANWVTFSADAPDASWGVWQSKGKIRELGTSAFRYVNGASDGSISSLKGNFDASTDYEWHTKAWCTGNVDENGNPDPMYHSGWGDFSSFTTEAPCDKMPINLTTSTNGANTAVIMSWDTPESGAPDHYFLEMTNVTTGNVFQWNNIPGTDNSKTKFGQNVGDEISWRIRGACGANGTSWATIFSQPVSYTLGGARLENSSLSNLDVYPNPSRDLFNISFTSEEAQGLSVKVVNMIGEEIYSEELNEFVGQYTKVIDMNTQPKGVYFLEITTSTGGINKKIVLQ